ncbi:MAG: hypothetical protein JRE14_08980 [Deltaproteobacteria bacterium]|nr:hypothetical protein [Deltaproteobacteria bacterium]
MIFIISDVASYARTGICVGLFVFDFAGGVYRWQTSIQASIPLRIKSARPKLELEKFACLLKTRERSDS